MPTITEIPQSAVPERTRERPTPAVRPAPTQVRAYRDYKPMFSDCLLGETGLERKRKTATTSFSFILQCILLGIMALLPLMFTEALPKAQLLTFLAAPP